MKDSASFCIKCGKENKKPSDAVGGLSKSSAGQSETAVGHPKPLIVRARTPIRKIIMVGVPVLLVLLIIGMATVFAFHIWDEKDKESMGAAQLETTEETVDSETVQTEAQVEESAVMTTEDTAAVTVSKTPDEEKAIYISYIMNTLIPEYGLANMNPFSLTVSWEVITVNVLSEMPQENKGILSCATEDINNDGSLELLVTAAVSNYSEDQSWKSQGVEIHVFSLKDNLVQELPLSGTANDLPDELTHCCEEMYQVSIVNKENKKYIFISGYNNWPGEGLWYDDFSYSFYEVTDKGVNCLDSISVYNGAIYDLLKESDSGTSKYLQVYDAWTDTSNENYFSQIKGYFDKYGVDSSWLESYYDNLVFNSDDYGNTTSSTQMDNLYKPISEMAQDVSTITTITGIEKLSPAPSTQTYSITDYTNIRAVLGTESAVGEENKPLAAQPRIQVVPNAEVENEVLHVREVWNTYQKRIKNSEFVKTELDAGVIAYSNGSEIVTIEVAAGYAASSYARTYTYENGKLIFAFFYNDSEENRLYIQADQLYRWRYTLGSNDPVNYDNTADNAAYLSWEIMAVEEGNQLLLLANG